jgi:hypothetical protein
MYLPTIKNNSGQTILVILLILAVVLTISLSAISTSITDIKISQQTEEASRAYYVAESALENQFLLPASAPLTESGNLGGIHYEVSRVAQEGLEYLLPNQLEAGQTQTVWLVGHNDDGTINETTFFAGSSLDFYFGNSAVVGGQPAVTISLVIRIYLIIFKSIAKVVMLMKPEGSIIIF